MRERWGTFSVRDHVGDAPFVSEVLLYDRLVIPVPDPKDSCQKRVGPRKDGNPNCYRNVLMSSR